MLRIWHNPRCSKSRQTLELLHENGIEPEIVEYLKTPLSATALKRIIGQLGIKATELVRTKEKLFKELCPGGGLTETKAVILMVEHPKLIERPIVVCGSRAVIGRPPENIQKLL